MSYKEVLREFYLRELEGKGHKGPQFHPDQLQAELTWELVKWLQQKEGTPDQLIEKFAESYCTFLRSLGPDRQKQMLQEASDDTKIDLNRWISGAFQELVAAKYKKFQEEIQ